MVPTKSKTPIRASTEAASTSAMPKSLQSGMKWVCISPTVESPQMAKVPNRIQKTRLAEASASAPKALRTGLPAAGRGRHHRGSP